MYSPAGMWDSSMPPTDFGVAYRWEAFGQCDLLIIRFWLVVVMMGQTLWNMATGGCLKASQPEQLSDMNIAVWVPSMLLAFKESI